MNTQAIMPKEEKSVQKQIASDDAPDLILGREPAPLDSFQLEQGVLVDKDGRRVALVKPQTWY